MSATRTVLAAAAASMIAATAASAADFYAGKTITFVVGFNAGGGADLACRLIAEYMGAHIAGKPDIIVKNQVGAGGIIAINYVGKAAKPDGLTALCGNYDPYSQVLKQPELQVDLTKFNVITGDGDTGIYVMRKDVPPGVNSPADIFKVKDQDIILAGFGVDSSKDIGERLFLELLGFEHYKYVTGFSGDTQAFAAMQQKFVNIYAGGGNDYMATIYPTLIQTGIALPVFQNGRPDAQGHLTQRDPRLPDIPTMRELYQGKYGKQPSGPKLDLVELMMASDAVAQHAVMLPPGSPPDAVAAMRAAVEPLNHDPDFVSASEKLRGPGAIQQPANVVEDTLDRLLHMPPDLLQTFQDMLKTGPGLVSGKSSP